MTYELDYKKVIVSRGIYELETGYAVDYMQPCKDGGSSETTPSKKYLARPYDDPASIETSIGLAESKMIADPGVASEAAKLQRIADPRWRDRSLGLVIWGEARVTNMQSGYTTAFGAKLAPHSGGFTSWKTNMSKLGVCLQPGVTEGQKALMMVDLEAA